MERCHAHGGTEISISAFQENTLTKGKLQDPAFTINYSPTNQTTSSLLPTWDPMGLDHGLQR